MSETKKRKRRGERKDGLIQVTLTIDNDKDTGKRIRKSFYGKSRAEAERKRNEYLDSLKRGIDPKENDITVSQWIPKWIEMYGVNENDYAPYISRIKQEFGKIAVKYITEGMLVKSLRSFEGKSKSGATKYRMILKQCFHAARRNHIISDDPAEYLQLPETTEGSHRALERWETQAIIDNWHIHPAGRWAMIMLLCGLRRGEMAALQWDCVNLSARTITVKRSASFKNGTTIINDHTKTDAGMRILPMCDELYFMLLETPEEQRNGFVCLSSTGKQISGTSAQRNWDTYCKMVTRVLNGEKANIRGFRTDKYKSIDNLEKTKLEPIKSELRYVFDVKAHDLRHTFATMLFQAGVDIKSAQYYLGHSDPRMTMDIYTHLTAELENKSRINYIDFLKTALNGSNNA